MVACVPRHHRQESGDATPLAMCAVTRITDYHNNITDMRVYIL
jgi:hypothetical protein